MKIYFLQAVECYLANVIPPNGTEWPFESAIHLEQLTNTSRQTLSRVSPFFLWFFPNLKMNFEVICTLTKLDTNKTTFQGNSCRVIGTSEDLVPIGKFQTIFFFKLKSNFPLNWHWEMKSSYFPPIFGFWNWDSAWMNLLKWSHLNSRRFSNLYRVYPNAFWWQKPWEKKFLKIQMLVGNTSLNSILNVSSEENSTLETIF